MGVCAIAAGIFSYYFVPETKGRTLEDIEEFWHAKNRLPLRLKCTKQSRWNLIFNSIWMGFLCFVPADLRFPRVIVQSLAIGVDVSNMTLLLGRYEKLVRIATFSIARQYVERFRLEDISAGARVLRNLREH